MRLNSGGTPCTSPIGPYWRGSEVPGWAQIRFRDPPRARCDISRPPLFTFVIEYSAIRAETGCPEM